MKIYENASSAVRDYYEQSAVDGDNRVYRFAALVIGNGTAKITVTAKRDCSDYGCEVGAVKRLSAIQSADGTSKVEAGGGNKLATITVKNVPASAITFTVCVEYTDNGITWIEAAVEIGYNAEGACLSSTPI